MPGCLVDVKMKSDVLDILESAFHPKAVAVVGASDNPISFGHHYVRHLLDYGYRGHIYPVNPSKEVILGLKTYPSLSSIPEPVDYVICCIPASMVVDLLAECPAKGVKVVHMVAGRLSETGRQEAIDLEAEILQAARRFKVCLIGPNCMGLYYPREGIAYGYDLSREPGTVGAVFQSGGASELLVRHGELRGLRFSKVISYGNALDLDESDFLNYLAHDNETKVIAGYFEGVKDGRKFLNALADAAHAKPVIAIKGGRGIAGTKAAASHTAAIAGSATVWETAFKKAGVIQARDLSELVDFLVAFSFLPPIRGNRTGIIMTAGGGLCVMAADICEEAGLAVSPLPPEIREELRVKAPEIWDWMGNPVDASVLNNVSVSWPEGLVEITRMLARSPHIDLIIAELTDDSPFSEELWNNFVKNQAAAMISLTEDKPNPLIGVVDSGLVGPARLPSRPWKVLAELRAQLIQAGIPTYSTVSQAVNAVRQFIKYWQAGMRG